VEVTLDIDDELLERATATALEAGVSLSDVLNWAIRRGLDSGASLPVTTATLMFGDPAERIETDLTAFGEALDEAYLLSKVMKA
jgi:hypothetical protein